MSKQTILNSMKGGSDCMRKRRFKRFRVRRSIRRRLRRRFGQRIGYRM